MLYRPNFCCNCGEKIERATLSFTDSKMFCDVCKHDFVLARAVPVVFYCLMAVIGIFGIGSWWRGGEKPLNLAARQPAVNAPGVTKPAKQAPQVNSNSNVQQTAQTNNLPTNAPQTSSLTAKPQLKQVNPAPAGTEEAVYFCGAPTKKGTPCSRRVRGGGRCWQHKGQTLSLIHI